MVLWSLVVVNQFRIKKVFDVAAEPAGNAGQAVKVFGFADASLPIL